MNFEWNNFPPFFHDISDMWINDKKYLIYSIAQVDEDGWDIGRVDILIAASR